MKKLIFLMFIVLFIPFNVNAIHEVLDPDCTVSLKTSLRDKGNNLVYRFGRDEENNIVTFTLYFYNLSNDLNIKVDKENVSNGKVSGLKSGTRTTINIYASSNNPCSSYKVLTKVINVPYYNPYFGSDMCIGYEDYYLCKENINVSLTKEEFVEKNNEYKEEIKEEEKKDVEDIVSDDKLDFFDYLYEYWIYIMFVIIIIAIVITIIIIRKYNKERGIL